MSFKNILAGLQDLGDYQKSDVRNEANSLTDKLKNLKLL